MSNVLWTILSLIAYAGGLVLMLKMTPKLLERSYDEGLFMVIAAGDIFGAILAFGGVIILYALFNAQIAVKIFGFLMLLGILVVSLRLALFSLRSRFVQHANRVSRIIAGIFCLCLAFAAFYYMIQLFLPNGGGQ
ncbi:MAG TPA: hypothetical protein VL461_15160 [Dictyobacter sp.]|jgi:hypothetical protein|nr:hypothetical protein [Dictyobacter sp.]